MTTENSGEESLVYRLEEKGLVGYDTQRAYDALEDVYAEDGGDIVESFIGPLHEVDEGSYSGKEPLSKFDQKFEQLLERRKGSAEEAVYGYELANDVVESKEVGGAKDELEEFEEFSEEKLDGMLRNTKVVFEEIDGLDDEEYREAVLFHSMRRVVQHAHDHQPWNSEKFDLSDQ